MAVATAPGTGSSPAMSVSFNIANSAPVNNNSPSGGSSNNGNGSACTIQNLLQAAKNLAERMSEHGKNVEDIINQSTEVKKIIEDNQKVHDEFNNLTENNRPDRPLNNRYKMLKGIQFENKKIKDLQRDNDELKQALEEHQNAMELIMSKYREHVSALAQYARLDFTQLRNVNREEIEQKNAKILEMVAVMQHVVRLDENTECSLEQKIAQLEHENRTLRELLAVSRQFEYQIKVVSSHPHALPAMPPDAQQNQSSDSSPKTPETGNTSNSSEDMSEGGSSQEYSPSFEYPSRTVKKKRPSLGLNSSSNTNTVTALFSADNTSSYGNQNVSENDNTPVETQNGTVVNGIQEQTTEREHVRFNGPSNNIDYSRGGTPYVTVPHNDYDSGLSMSNHHMHGSTNSISSASGAAGGGGMKYRYGSETDIISDTDSDSSSNASTVTLTPCTSDREDNDENPIDAESLVINSVVEEVEQFSKAASNCLTNGVFDPADFHNVNTTTGGSNNQNQSTSAAGAGPLTPENEASLPNGVA